nr:MAG TPA: ribosomal L5P family protein [Caudoviricetes sp.]
MTSPRSSERKKMYQFLKKYVSIYLKGRSI